MRVMSLNVWGMPAKVGSEDKELRIKVNFTIINVHIFIFILPAKVGSEDKELRIKVTWTIMILLMDGYNKKAT